MRTIAVVTAIVLAVAHLWPALAQTGRPKQGEAPSQPPLPVLGPLLDTKRARPVERGREGSGVPLSPGQTVAGERIQIDIPSRPGLSPKVFGGTPAPGTVSPKVSNGTPAPGDVSGRPAGKLVVVGEQASASLLSIVAGRQINAETPAPEDPFRLVIAILYRDWGSNNQSLCTGTILGGQHVLTAGHCGCGDPDSYQIIIDDTVTWQSLLFSLAGPPILLDQRVCHGGKLYGNDLALLTIKTGFRCEGVFRPPAGSEQLGATPSLVTDCRSQEARQRSTAFQTFGYPKARLLEMQPPLKQGDMLAVTGYGYTESHSKGTRMQGQVPIMSVACAEPRFAGICAPFSEMILAHPAGSGRYTDTCGGDSGGPVFLIEDGRYTLVAVTSRPAPFAHLDSGLHCGGGGIYTLIGRKVVHDWLAANGIPPVRILDYAAMAKAAE